MKDLFSEGSVEEAQIITAKEFLEEKGYLVSNDFEYVKNWLIGNGYKVLDPIVINKEINTGKKLYDYFYARLFSKYPERQYTIHKNEYADLRLINKFIEARMDGVNKENAIQECIAIIDIIFDHEEEFGFERDITIGVLGQASARWVTEKALFILNRLAEEVEEKRVDKLFVEIEEKGIDLERRSNKLEKILNNLEADIDGKGKKESESS